MSPGAARGEDSVTINATPELVYALVSDVTRTPEWSPECVRVEWQDDAAEVRPGARFVGHNQQGGREWAMECVVDEVTPGHRFAFHTVRGGRTRTQWGYRLAPSTSGGTVLTEWYERVASPPLVARLVERIVLGGRAKHNAANLRASLARIKALLEGG
ncbi:MAG: SRPBCC family protein [Mycobacteriales bacterium]